MNQHIEIPQIEYTDKVADESVAVQRQISPRTTETKAPEHQQDDRSGGDTENYVQGEAIPKYSSNLEEPSPTDFGGFGID